ncbi:MAG TPA: class I SAM-dependent methyltransferase [Solirubrobacterales bacterium]|nr:class I SAM-dependent methyltransferase [Solirubrobacterales bacterium]
MAHDKFITITPELHRYSVEHSSFRDGAVPGVEQAGEAMGDLASMQIAGDQAAFMTILVRAIGAHDALEVGTFLGYGALAIARGLPDDGRLVCCELSEEYAERARDHLREAGLDGKVEIRVGPAVETLRAMEPGEQFDFAFIDADKTEYIDYFEEALPRMRPNGVILLDNTLRDGTVLDPGESEAARVTAELNDRLAGDDRVEVALLGFADGITMVRKR